MSGTVLDSGVVSTKELGENLGSLVGRDSSGGRECYEEELGRVLGIPGLGDFPL